MKSLFPALLVAFSLNGCHAPVTLSQQGTVAYRADEIVVAIGTLQHAAIALNGVKVCTPAPPCHPLLSDANTRIVVDSVTDALVTLKATPSGWKPTATAAVQRISARLDADGKHELAAYLTAAQTVIAQF